MKIFIINIRASKNISGLVNVTVTSPAVEPCSSSCSSSSSSLNNDDNNDNKLMNCSITVFHVKNLLLAASKSHILSAPDMEPATTISSALPNLTASTGLVWPDKL